MLSQPFRELVSNPAWACKNSAQEFIRVVLENPCKCFL
jgi:hypothetical protein